MKKPTPVQRHSVFLHPELSFSGATERLAATAHVLEGQGTRVTLLSKPGSQSRGYEAAGFELCDLELPASPLESPFAFRRLRRQVQELAPTLLHATDASLAGLTASLASGIGVPYVLEIHHQVGERLPRARDLLSAVIATSESLTEGIVNHGRLPRELVRTVRHAPRPVEFPDLTGPFEHDGPPRIGCAGYLDHRHSTEWFLEAARTLVRAGRKCQFFILGEGPRELQLRRAIREANLTQHVTMGVPTTALTARTLASLDVYVSCRVAGGPSWISGQALAQGVPSIFAAAGEAFHLVRDRHSGVLTEPHDGRRLAEEIELMIDNPEFSRTMGKRGREHVLETLPPARFEREVAGIHAVALGAAVST